MLCGGHAGCKDGPLRAALFQQPSGVAPHPEGLVVADTGNHRIRLVSRSTTVSTLAGGVRARPGGARRPALDSVCRKVLTE